MVYLRDSENVLLHGQFNLLMLLLPWLCGPAVCERDSRLGQTSQHAMDVLAGRVRGALARLLRRGVCAGVGITDGQAEWLTGPQR